MSMTLQNGDGQWPARGKRSRTVVSGQWKGRWQRTTDHGPRTTGFTLVEMLVVITIIGVLVALASVAAYKALEAAKKARIKAEITNIESALQQMKTQYGDYPPSDFISGNISTDPTHPVRLFVAKAFPRVNEPTATWTSIQGFTPAQALTFWLRGFSPDVTLPLSGKGDRKPFFDFDSSRLYDPATDAAFNQNSTTVMPVYKPQGSKVPYVYFNAKSYVTHNTTTSPPLFTYTPVSNSGVCIPYMWDANGDGTIDVKDYDANNNGKLDPNEQPKLYVNPKSFQIISAGLDGDYGTAPTTSSKSFPLPSGTLTISRTKLYPTGAGYDPSGADDDNIVNFSKGTSLGDDKP